MSNPSGKNGAERSADDPDAPTFTAAQERYLDAFRAVGRALFNLGVEAETMHDHETREGATDVLAMLKEIQGEAEERQVVAADRRRAAARERAAAKAKAPPPLPPKPRGMAGSG